MNGHPMHKARAALTLHPPCAAIIELQDAPVGTRHLVTLMQYGVGFFDHEGGRVDQRQGCLPSARSPRRFLPRSCEVERLASGLGSILNSVICEVSRGKLQGRR